MNTQQMMLNRAAGFVVACTLAGVAHAEQSVSPTRDQLHAEVLVARNSGELFAMAGEDSGSFWLAQHTPSSTLTRARVQAELMAAGGPLGCAALAGEDSGSMALSVPLTAGGLRYAGPNIGDRRAATEAQPIAAM